MATAYAAAFDNGDFGGFGRGLPVFDGYCQNQDTGSAATNTSTFTTILTVAADNYYTAVYVTVPSKIYVGPSPVVEARAPVYPAGWWPASAAVGHIVSVKELG